MINYALTTKERMKNRLQIEDDQPEFDGLLDGLIKAVTARIEKMCNRRFLQTAYTNELYDGSDMFGSPALVLMIRNAPISGLPLLKYKAGNNENPAWFEYSINDYDLDAEDGLAYMNGGLPRGKQNVSVSYTGGYVIDFTGTYDTGDDHTLPFEVTEVCEEVVSRLFKRRQSEGRANEGFQESQITWNTDVFTPENVATIKNYRRASFV